MILYFLCVTLAFCHEQAHVPRSHDANIDTGGLSLLQLRSGSYGVPNVPSKARLDQAWERLATQDPEAAGMLGAFWKMVSSAMSERLNIVTWNPPASPRDPVTSGS